MNKILNIINNRNEEEPFSIKKVFNSARRVGASKEIAQRISQEIKRQIYPNIKTSEIFEKIKKLLYKESKRASLKFSLKQAMRKLGPTGFPFEKYIGEIFSKLGYKVKINQYPIGHCLKYEIDFIAQKDNILYIGECKYRNIRDGLIHSQTALSNYARFLDIKKGPFGRKFNHLDIKTIIVTNTKFTSSTIKFAKCTGTELLGWKQPKQRGLEYIIDSKNLYPITILPSLKKNMTNIFISKKIMLAQDILNIESEELFGNSKSLKIELEKLKKEARILLNEEI